MADFRDVSRRKALALGVTSIGSVLAVESVASERTRVYESTSRAPTAPDEGSTSPILPGEPSLDAEMPVAEAFVFRSREEAERRMAWDALLPPETSEPYSDIGSGEATSVVVSVAPVASDVHVGPASIRNGIVHHQIEIRDRPTELWLSMDEDTPVRNYSLSKWKLGFGVDLSGATVDIEQTE